MPESAKLKKVFSNGEITNFADKSFNLISAVIGSDIVEDPNEADAIFINGLVELIISWKIWTERKKRMIYEEYLKNHPEHKISFQDFKIYISRAVTAVANYLKYKLKITNVRNKEAKEETINTIFQYLNRASANSEVIILRLRQGMTLDQLSKLFPGIEDYLEQ